MKFNYLGKEAYLTWYTQELVTASLVRYGQEVLSRGFIFDSNSAIPTKELILFIRDQNELLLQMTCQQIADFSYNKNIDDHLVTWINLAGPLIVDDDLFAKLWDNILCKLTAEEKQLLVLEICEDDMSSQINSERVAYLKKQGFVIAMDDFGSGYSNLLRLSQTPFDIIKLDLTLLKNVPFNLWKASFYKEIVNLCSATGCLIVAEGVETQIQSDFVRWAGVDLIQGFFYSKPEQYQNKVWK